MVACSALHAVHRHGARRRRVTRSNLPTDMMLHHYNNYDAAPRNRREIMATPRLPPRPLQPRSLHRRHQVPPRNGRRRPRRRLRRPRGRHDHRRGTPNLPNPPQHVRGVRRSHWHYGECMGTMVTGVDFGGEPSRRPPQQISLPVWKVRHAIHRSDDSTPHYQWVQPRCEERPLPWLPVHFVSRTSYQNLSRECRQAGQGLGSQGHATNLCKDCGG